MEKSGPTREFGSVRAHRLLFKGLMNTYGFEKALEHHIKSRTEIDEDFIKS